MQRRTLLVALVATVVGTDRRSAGFGASKPRGIASSTASIYGSIEIGDGRAAGEAVTFTVCVGQRRGGSPCDITGGERSTSSSRPPTAGPSATRTPVIVGAEPDFAVQRRPERRSARTSRGSSTVNPRTSRTPSPGDGAAGALHDAPVDQDAANIAKTLGTTVVQPEHRGRQDRLDHERAGAAERHVHVPR